MCQKKHPFFLCPILLPYPCPLDTSQFLQHHSGEGAFIHRWEDPKEGSWRPKPHLQETWSPRGFSELFQPRGSFGCGRCSFTAGGLVWIWRLWDHAERSRLTRSMGQGSLAGTLSPARSAPWQSIIGNQVCPGHQGLRGIESEFSFYNLYFVLVYRWLTMLYGLFVCFLLGGQQHDSLMHRCVHVLFGFSSHIVYYAVWSRGHHWFFVKSSVCMFISTCSFLDANHISLLVTIRCFAMLWGFLFGREVHLYPSLGFSTKWYHMMLVFLCLPALSMIVSTSSLLLDMAWCRPFMAE